jgi:hypothetical protein
MKSDKLNPEEVKNRVAAMKSVVPVKMIKA